MTRDMAEVIADALMESGVTGAQATRLLLVDDSKAPGDYVKVEPRAGYFGGRNRDSVISTILEAAGEGEDR